MDYGHKKKKIINQLSVYIFIVYCVVPMLIQFKLHIKYNSILLL